MPKPQQTESRFESVPVPDAFVQYNAAALAGAPIELVRDAIVLHILSDGDSTVTVRMAQDQVNDIVLHCSAPVGGGGEVLMTFHGRFHSIRATSAGVSYVTVGYVA